MRLDPVSDKVLEATGALRGYSPAQILKALNSEKASGSLIVETEGHRLTAALRDGQPFFALSTDPEDRLGNLLIRENLVTLAELTTAIEQMLKGQQRLGDVLVGDGILSESILGEALRAQAREILHRMLAPGNDRRTSLQGEVTNEDIGFTVPVNALIRGALIRSGAFHRILEGIGGPNSTFAPAGAFTAEVGSAGFTDAEQETVALFEKPIGLRQLCSRSPLTNFQACRLAWILLTIRAVTQLE